MNIAGNKTIDKWGKDEERGIMIDRVDLRSMMVLKFLNDVKKSESEYT